MDAGFLQATSGSGRCDAWSAVVYPRPGLPLGPLRPLAELRSGWRTDQVQLSGAERRASATTGEAVQRPPRQSGAG